MRSMRKSYRFLDAYVAKYSQNIFSKCQIRSASTEPAASLAKDLRSADDSDSVQSRGQAEVKKFVTEKPKLSPFAKNLFLGKFDKELLVYPQMKKEEVDDLNELIQPIEKAFSEGIDSKAMDVAASIPKETLDLLKELGLFGQQIPEEYGGLNLNATQYARIAEITSMDGSLAVTLAAHQAIGLKGILIAGTEAQKQKYLPKLATGELVAAFALTEPTSGSDAASIQTRATLSEDGKTFYLNGGKIWISNGGIADIFTVFAKTEVTNDAGQKEDRVTAFIVERAFGGVTSGKPEDKLGIRASNTCEVHFDNTPIPIENVIGEVGSGFKLAMNILNGGRFSMGSSGAGSIKRMFTNVAEQAVTRSQFGKKLSEFGLIQEKIAKMATIAYAMESMAYLTARVLDEYDDPDASVEAAMVKIFSSEGAWYCADQTVQIFAGSGYMKDLPYERHLRDSRIMLIFEGTNEILRLFVALNGVQHAGKELKELVKKLRNPFNNPKLVLGLVFKRMFKSSESPKLSLRLKDEVHPTLGGEADILEKGTLLLKAAVERALEKHGNKIINEQMVLKRLADISIDLYAMTACIGRSSRAYCTGMKNCDHEVQLTKAFCKDADARIMQNFRELLAGVNNNDENYKQIAEKILKNKGWAAEHPLTHNF